MVPQFTIYMDITFIIINKRRFSGRERGQRLSWFALEGNSAWRGRVASAEYWEAGFKAVEDKFRHLAGADFRLYKAMQEWHNRIGDANS
jgi:hypothetical protein